MMAITKEYVCLAHGDFDAPSATCPFGCHGEIMVQRAFRTAPAIQTAGYRNINRTFESLAAEHGLSNMSNRGGDGMRRASWDTHKRLNEAALQITAGKAIQGEDAGNYFKPLSDWGHVGSSAQSALRKAATRIETDAAGKEHIYGSGQTLVGDGIALDTPKPRIEAKPFDGKHLGLPAGDE